MFNYKVYYYHMLNLSTYIVYITYLGKIYILKWKYLMQWIHCCHIATQADIKREASYRYSVLTSPTYEFLIIFRHISKTCPICVRGFIVFSLCLFFLKHISTLNTHDKIESLLKKYVKCTPVSRGYIISFFSRTLNGLMPLNKVNGVGLAFKIRNLVY